MTTRPSFVCVMLPSLFTCAAFILSSLSNASQCDSEDCSKTLQGIISKPNECAQNYLENINEKLKLQTPLLFGPQQQQVIDNFENTFGVTVTVNSPFPSATQSSGLSSGEICIPFTNNTATTIPGGTVAYFGFDNTAYSDYAISNMYISLNAVYPDIENSEVSLTYFDEDPYQSLSLISFPTSCSGDPGFVGTFADGVTETVENFCDSLTSGMTFQPAGGSNAIMTSIEDNDVKFNTPIYLFTRSGLITQFNSATLTICTTDPVPITITQNFNYTSDIAQSKLNIPGFRKDSGNYYYTSEYQYIDGQMLDITISVPVTNIIC